MPPFQYETYRNPYGPSIAEALQHQADPQAAAALRGGDIQAAAALQRGALRAQQFGTLGAIPGEIQAERDRAIVRQRAAQQQQIGAQQLELGGYQVDAARRDAKTRNVMDAELRNPANRNPDGSLNDERFMQALQQQDVGAWQTYGAMATKNQQARLELAKTLAEINEKTATASEKAQKVREAQIGFISKASLSGYDALQQHPDDPLHARDTANAFVANLIGSGAITPQQGAQFHLQTARAGPDQLAGTFLQMTDPELRAKIAKEQAEAAAAGKRVVNGQIVELGSGARVGTPVPPQAPVSVPLAEQELTAYAQSIGKPGAADLTYAERQTFDANKERIRASAAFQQHMQTRNYDVAHPVRDTDPLVRVEHQDANGRAVVEWLPQSTLKGQVFNKPTGGALDNRLASAQTVTQVGNDLIAKLSDPAFASTVGPIMGRYETLRQFVGNPPPEFSELAGEIESYALANMGVHGMRSYQGAKDISSHLLDRKMTPANLAAAIRGLNSFAVDLLKNEGRPVPTASAPGSTPAAPKVGDTVSVRGQNIKITAIHPDGTFDGDPVK